MARPTVIALASLTLLGAACARTAPPQEPAAPAGPPVHLALASVSATPDSDPITVDLRTAVLSRLAGAGPLIVLDAPAPTFEVARATGQGAALATVTAACRHGQALGVEAIAYGEASQRVSSHHPCLREAWTPNGAQCRRYGTATQLDLALTIRFVIVDTRTCAYHEWGVAHTAEDEPVRGSPEATVAALQAAAWTALIAQVSPAELARRARAPRFAPDGRELPGYLASSR